MSDLTKINNLQIGESLTDANGDPITAPGLADATNAGLVSTTTQTFGGAKTFDSVSTESINVTAGVTQTKAALSAPVSTTTAEQLLLTGNNPWNAPTQMAGQTFLAAHTGTLKEVSYWLENSNGATGTLSFDLYAV